LLSTQTVARLCALVLSLVAFDFASRAHADESLALFFANDRAGGLEQQTPSQARIHIGFSRRGEAGMLAGVSSQLAAKAREIASACGSSVISGHRHTRVAGTNRMSLHASGRAVDMRGNPSCIYAQLRDWPGGYSTDYGRVQHVHISLGGREDGLRFAHGGGRHRHYAGLHRGGGHHRHHYAHRSFRQYARA